MKHTVVCVSAVVLFVLLDFISGQQCTQDNIDKCVEPFTQYSNLTYITETMLNEACSKVNNVTVCITGSGCPADNPQVQGTWQGLQDGFNYLCGRRSDVLSKVPCWHNDNSKTALNACNTNYKTTLTANSSAICGATNTLLGCIKSGLTASCGEDSAKVYTTYSYRTLVPQVKAKMSSCTLDSSYDTLSAGSLCVSFVVPLLASMTSLLFWMSKA